MKKLILLCAALSFPLALSGCEKKDEPKAAENVTIDDQDLPVPSEFAEEAESIGNDDYKAKLDEIEAEIDKDK